MPAVAPGGVSGPQLVGGGEPAEVRRGMREEGGGTARRWPSGSPKCVALEERVGGPRRGRAPPVGRTRRTRDGRNRSRGRAQTLRCRTTDRPPYRAGDSDDRGVLPAAIPSGAGSIPPLPQTRCTTG